MFNKLRAWFGKDDDALVAEEGTMTAAEKRDLTDYEDHKVDDGGGGLGSYARQGRDHYDDDSERPRY